MGVDAGRVNTWVLVPGGLVLGYRCREGRYRGKMPGGSYQIVIVCFLN